MYIPQNKEFKYKDKTYVAKRQPKLLWPCEACQLADVCGELYGTPEFPACRSTNRDDHVDVVFYEVDKQ